MIKPLQLLLAVPVIAMILFILSFPFIMINLVVDEAPVPADIIIVPEGGASERARKSAELLDAGYSRSHQIMVSPLTAVNAPYYQEFGVAESEILPENASTSTYENAVNTLALMQENDFRSAIIVSADYHMLRTKLIYERVNQKYGYELTYVAAYHDVDGQLVPWYQAPQAQRIGQKEFFKYWGYLLGLYHFINLPEDMAM